MSSKSHPCRVVLGNHSIVLHIFDGESGSFSEIIWELDSISKNDLEISGRMRLKYGSFPHQSVEVEDKEFPASLHKLYPYFSFAKRDFVSAISKNWKIITGIFLLLIAFGIFSFKIIIPNIAEYAATKVPLSVEKAIGESAYNQISAFTSENSTKSFLVQEFFDEMKLKHNYDYTISVLNSETVNAFAVPGGRIAIYNGIIEEMDKPEELAALLAHESSHVELQHSLKSIFRTLSGYFFISLLFGDMGGITAVVFENIYVFQDLQYSREMEKEADIKGLESMQKAGINPEGMIDLFNAIQKNTPEMMGSNNLSEFVSTHPLTKRRIEYIQKHIDQDKQIYRENPKLDSLFNLITDVTRLSN